MDQITGKYQQNKADAKTNEALGQYAQGLDPAVAQEVAPLLRDPQTRQFGLQMIRDRTKPQEFGFTTAPDGTLLRTDPRAGTAEPIGKYAKPVAAGGGGSEYGLNPQYGVDANGNPVLLQLSKAGTARTTALPDGVSLSKEPIRLDAGTHFVLLDPITRQPIGQIAKDLAGAAEATAVGKGSGENIADARGQLPSSQSTAALIARQVKDLQEDPYLPNMLGPINSRTPNITADAARVQSKIDQLRGGAFLQARQMLKGGGAITDVEGIKAEQAEVRMSQAQNVKDFNAALSDWNDAVQEGHRKLERAAAGGQAPARTQTRMKFNPATGDFE